MIGLNCASAAFSVLTLALASWCALRLRLRQGHSDWQRCRAVSLLSGSSLCYSACQLLLAAQPEPTASSAVVKACLLGATLSVVLGAFMVVGEIGADSAVRFGLRSFGLAQRLGRYWDVGSVVCALLVSQPALYVFGELAWTGSALVAAKPQVSFAAAVWMVESAWVALSITVAGALTLYALIKANKLSRYATSCADDLPLSVLGTAASIQSRAAIALCYVAVFAVSRVWKLAFHAGGSSSAWLFTAASICEALLPMLVLPVFCADIAFNMRREGGLERLGAGSECSLDTGTGGSSLRKLGSRSFTSWRKTEFLEWQKQCSSLSSTIMPADSGMGTWAGEIKQCHIRPDTGNLDRDNYSVSDISFDGTPRRCSRPMIMYPLAP
ncbi:hypothetical protein LPJ61_002183 [Coemansia biformis]|uniref:THH1/TOM1/TOM3 domain-containing protein n=1 Tax=Coemansia biformis TaxID=1286918 RepID=A0A9W8CXF8_9FUNG|nr:hypothetical protein LPJ61_002183 [Coemansia biformis]